MRRFPLAFVLLGVLGVLAAGAAVLGAVQAPTGADVAVHNAAASTVGASPVAGRYSASYLGSDVIDFVFVAPNHVTEIARDADGKVKAHRSVTGAAAISVLAPFTELQSITGFSGPGPTYVNRRSVTTLAPTGQRSMVSGTYQTTVKVAGGFVVALAIAVTATEDGEHLSEHSAYRLTRVGSWEAS